MNISGGRASGPAITAKAWARRLGSSAARTNRLRRRAAAASPNYMSIAACNEATKRSRRIRSADVFFGLPGDSGPGLAAAVRIAPRLRWVQGTAAGAGEQVRAAALSADELERIAFTTSSGIHGD